MDGQIVTTRKGLNLIQVVGNVSGVCGGQKTVTMYIGDIHSSTGVFGTTSLGDTFTLTKNGNCNGRIIQIMHAVPCRCARMDACPRATEPSSSAASFSVFKSAREDSKWSLSNLSFLMVFILVCFGI